MIKQLCNIALLFINAYAFGQTVTLPYNTGFDSASEKAGWVEYKKGGTATGGWLFSAPASSAYSPADAVWQIYSTTENLDNWYVSPGFMLPAGGKLDSVRYMFNGFSTPALADTLALYLLKGSANPSSASKTLLFDFRGADYVNDATYRKKTNIALSSSSVTCYFAIRYKCTQGTWLQVYFDNIALSANPTTGIAEKNRNETDFFVAPNPASDFIIIYGKNKTDRVRIFNALGALVRTAEPDAAGYVHIGDLQNGVYFIQSTAYPGLIQKIIRQ